MKKLFAILLTISVLCGLFAGCGSSAEEAKPLSADGYAKNDLQEDTQDAAENQSEQDAVVSVEETVVYHSGDVKITVTGLEESWTGMDLKLLVENNTGRNIALSGMDAVVNGVTVSGYLYIDVAAGKKANGAFSFYTEDLETAGIQQIAMVQVKDAAIVDTDSYATIAQAPFEIVTSLGADYSQPLDDSGEVLFETGEISVIAKVIAEEFYGRSVLLYVKNESEKDVIVQAENISVNGFTVDAWLYDTVYAGTVRFCGMELFASGLEENGITEIEDVSFTVSVIDAYSFSTIAQSEELQVFVTE